jgi:hypothetical protein
MDIRTSYDRLENRYIVISFAMFSNAYNDLRWYRSEFDPVLNQYIKV